MLSRSPVQNLQEDMSTSWWVNTDTIPFVLFKVARISGARDPAEVDPGRHLEYGVLWTHNNANVNGIFENPKECML